MSKFFIFIFLLILVLSSCSKNASTLMEDKDINNYISIPKRYKLIDIKIENRETDNALTDLFFVLKQSIKEERYYYTVAALDDIVFLYYNLKKIDKAIEYDFYKYLFILGSDQTYYSYSFKVLFNYTKNNLLNEDKNLTLTRTFHHYRNCEFFIPEGEIEIPLPLNIYYLEKNSIRLDRISRQLFHNQMVLIKKVIKIVSELEVEGNTSIDEDENIGIQRCNIIKLMIEKSLKIKKEIILTNHGSKIPLADPNAGEIARAINRRVDIIMKINNFNAILKLLIES